VQGYLGLGFQPWNCLSFMGIVFSIYTLNCFTDTAEDYTNNLERLLFFQRKRVFLFMAWAALAASFLFLLASEKLNWMHALLLAVGTAYSLRIVPWYSAAHGFRLLRIKEVTLLKNLSVSFLWTGAIFVIPILYSGRASFDRFLIGMLAAGFFLSTLNNTLFDDILDEAGDRVAGIKTLPTTWGSAASHRMLIALDLAWLCVVLVCRAAGRIDTAHTALLVLLSIYPFVYMGLRALRKASKGWLYFLAESELLLFAVGMILLSLPR
jgi:4-hydroxybenzoate polyprenyltransferase